MMKFIYITISLFTFHTSIYGQVKLIESVVQKADLYIYEEGTPLIERLKLDIETPEGMLSSYMKDLRDIPLPEFEKYYIQNDAFKSIQPLFHPQANNFAPTYKLSLVSLNQKQVFIRGLINNEPFVYVLELEDKNWKIVLAEDEQTRANINFIKAIKPQKLYSLLQGNLNNNPLEKQILDIVTDQNGYINLTSLFSLAYNTWHLDEGKKYGYYFFGTSLD